jgi:tRNA A-37 threonylcarbamoyl transferase component Bud32
MTESGPQACESLSVWSKLLTEDIARVIGAQEIGIWKIEDEEFIPLVPSQMDPPSLNEIKLSTSNFVEREKQAMIPIRGTTSEIYGVILVARENLLWSDPERHLVASFANRLGGTLEMELMREKLARAEHQKAATLHEMWDQGIATLQLCPVCRRCYDHTGVACETDGALLTAPRILPHKISDRYRLTKFLGEGGMGAVFKAHDEKLRRDVSLKIIRAERLSDPTMRFRIKREAQILAQIQHPGVISVFDFGELPDGSAFMVMEYLEGEDLQNILKRDGPGTPQQVAMVLQQVGEALNTSHARGVIHRDLKPSNLFVVNSGSPEFQIKVLDFGLAKSVNDDSPLTATGLIIGTPAYMSPEQAQGHLMNEQSDLFSLASLTYELLTGEQAFKGDNVVQVLSKIVFGDPEPLSSLVTELPKELDAIFIEAMARKGSDRPKNLLQWTKQVVTLLAQTPNSVPGWRLVEPL